MMYLACVRIEGFQSFKDSGEVHFKPGMNLIVGQNNAGKSSLLKAMQSTFPDDRHRSLSKWRPNELPIPRIKMDLVLDGGEFRAIILQNRGQWQIPVRQGGNPENQFKGLLENKHLRFTFKKSPTNWEGDYEDDNGPFYQFPRGFTNSMAVSVDNANINVHALGGKVDNTPALFQNVWTSKSFFLDAQRLNIGRSGVGHSLQLASNAGNLPVVLATMSSDLPDAFEVLKQHMREIFPTVGNIATRIDNHDTSMLEVRVWPTIERRHVDLSFSLEQSGTGVAQVLALLTSVMTKDQGVIVIDEINSFLHPAAVKTLLRILQTSYGHHQYILSTHAPEVVGFSNPSSVMLVRREGYNSYIDRLQPGDVGHLKAVASTLGVAMADVFAADRIIWVEGESEQLIFPYIYTSVHGVLPHGTIFSTVVSTGDFQGSKSRTRKLVSDIYNRLSSAIATMPIEVVFAFDSETFSKETKDSMIAETGGKLSFLPRRHLECYLVHPDAIAHIIKLSWSESSISTGDVVIELDKLAQQRKYYKAWNGDLRSDVWLASVDAANLIKEAVDALTGSRVVYDKIRHGLAITKFIIDNDPNFLLPLVEYIRELVDRVSERKSA